MAIAPVNRPHPRHIIYPTSDGKPMGETERHVNQIIYSISALRTHFADRSDVYVCGNNLVFWEEGNPRAFVSPDTYVVFGVMNVVRDSYKSWEEGGKLPDVVFEFTSRQSRREDTQKKYALYEQVWKVSEYFLFDPSGDYLKPRLQGFRLTGGVFVPIATQGERLYSEKLALYMTVDGERMRFYDPQKKRFLPTPQEEALRAEAENLRAELALRRAEAEARARADIEAEFTRFRAEVGEELARLRAEIEALKRQ